MPSGGDAKVTVWDGRVGLGPGARVRPWGAGPCGRSALGLLAACLAAGSAGCGQQFGAFLYWTGLYPKPTVKAEFTLTKGPLLILVEDDYNVTRSRAVRDAIAKALARELAARKVNHRALPLERLDRLRQQDPGYAGIPADKLGRRLEAEQVLWIKIIEYSIGDLEAEDPAEAARVVLTLRVINCHAQHRDEVRLWPGGREPYRLEVTKALAAVQGLSPDKVELLLVVELVDQIAKLFYDHKIEPE